MEVYENNNYKLCELNGGNLKISIAGKKIKVFKRHDNKFIFQNLGEFWKT